VTKMHLMAAVLALGLVCCGCGEPAEAQVQVEVFFTKAQAQQVELVAVTRAVSSETPRAKAVLEELLKGPTTAERQRGLSTLINGGVVLRSVSTDSNGVVHADFDEKLQEGVGGSMRVLGIRQQIETTLLKIPGVVSVILSIGGQSEGILQP
jgi:spore germination protein GerM